jgi:hypothetical protein
MIPTFVGWSRRSNAGRAAALAQRNEALRRLRARLWPALEPDAAAALMVARFRTYASARWPRERDDLVAPLTEPAATFWKILRDCDAGAPRMPGVRQLAAILGG